MFLPKIKLIGFLVVTTILVCNAVAQKNVVVRPVEINDVLINPGMGFTTFQMFNGDNLAFHDVLNEADINAFGNSISPTNRASPITSIAYFRLQWRLVEPEQSRYRWDFIDALLDTVHKRMVGTIWVNYRLQQTNIKSHI